MLDSSGFDVWMGVVTFLVLTAASVPVFRWIARREGDPWLSRILLIALLVHFVGAMARYYMIFLSTEEAGTQPDTTRRVRRS